MNLVTTRQHPVATVIIKGAVNQIKQRVLATRLRYVKGICRRWMAPPGEGCPSEL